MKRVHSLPQPSPSMFDAVHETDGLLDNIVGCCRHLAEVYGLRYRTRERDMLPYKFHALTRDSYRFLCLATQ